MLKLGEKKFQECTDFVDLFLWMRWIWVGDMKQPEDLQETVTRQEVAKGIDEFQEVFQ